MVDFIKDNALIVIAVGSFVVLVAIGFIVDTFILHKKPKENKKEEKTTETVDNVQPEQEITEQPTVQPEQEIVEQPTVQPEQEVVEQTQEVVEEVQPQEPVTEEVTETVENQMPAPEIEEVNESLFHKPEEPNNGDSPWEV